MLESRPSPRQVPLAALGAIADAWDIDPEEVTSYIDLETGEVVPVFDDARRDLEAVYELLPDNFNDGTLEDQRSALANAIENANHLSSEPVQIEEAFVVERGLGTTFLELPRWTTSDGHEQMEAFVNSLPAGRLRNRLDDAIRGRGAFRRFKDELRREPDVREQWFAFQRDDLVYQARRWLHIEGIDLANA